LLPSITGSRVRLVSPCHATQQPVTVTISPGGFENVEPSSAVVSFWPRLSNGCDIRGSTCDNQNLFASADAAASWLAERPGSIALPVAEALVASLKILPFIEPPQKAGKVARETLK